MHSHKLENIITNDDSSVSDEEAREKDKSIKGVNKTKYTGLMKRFTKNLTGTRRFTKAVTQTSGIELSKEQVNEASQSVGHPVTAYP